jgi:hypothetical protein
MERTSNKGLIVRNYSSYNTDDIMAVVNKVEELLSRKRRLSIRRECASINIVQTRQPFAPQVRASKNRMERRRFFSRIGHPRSAKAGVITVSSPKHLFDNAVEQLAFEVMDVKLAPLSASLDLAATLALSVYAPSPMEPAVAAMTLGPFREEELSIRFRVNDKPEHSAPKGPNREEERRGRQVKNRMCHELGQAEKLVRAVFVELQLTNMSALQEELQNTYKTLCHLRTLLDESRVTVNTTPTKETEA